MNVPKLRFRNDDGREFSEWKSFLMSELGEFKNGINKSKEDFGHGVPFVNLMDVFGKPYFKNSKLSLVNANPNEIQNYNLFRGDVLFIRSSVKPEGVGETSVILEDLNSTVYSGFLIRFRESSERINLFYKKYCFSNSSFRNQIFSVSTTSANTNINQDSLNNLSISLPSLPEQTKIANFLTAVDEKIQQLTQKSDLHAQYKKGVMQKIFSQELRFKDDDGRDFPEWEEKTLRELLDIVVDNRGKTPPIESVGNPLIEVNAIGNRDVKFGVITKYVSDTTYENWFRKHIKDGDVLFSTVGATALCSYFKDENSKSTIAQNIVGLRFKLPNSGLFMFYLLTEKNNNQKFKTIEMGAVQPSVKVSQMIHLVFKVPLPKEQTKIANFLTAIDDKINQTQAELNAVKQYKQGLLQQMFV